jgi:DNA-binding FadR family transcriptional regulator
MSDQLRGRLEKSGQEHRQILDGLRSGDPARAEQAMRRHLESVLRDFSLSDDQPATDQNAKLAKELTP